MDRPDGATEKSDADAPWGTLEELLLACAVDRHGTDCWDSVAIEIQKRSSNSTFHHLLTPHHCKQRYLHLERRYAPKDITSDSDDDKKAETVRWLEELRKLRVEELRRELDRYDLSIVSLQRKVKRLKEEQEEDLRDGENGDEKPDPDGREHELEKRGGTESEPDVSPESDRDNQSVNESNSTDPKGDDLKTRADETEPAGAKAEPVQSGLSKKTVRGDSCNGSSMDPNRNSVKAEEEAGPSESPEVCESAADSDGGGEEEGTSKESSDMQSSASRIRKKGEPDKGRSGSVSGEERENEDQSVAVKRLSRKSQPYVDVLEMVRAHKLGSIFERRLESQDTPEYRNLIRQHIDLHTISTRHKEGHYSGCYRKLHRDLLLLFNNAILFFGKKSKEYAAATELLDLVSKEVAQRKLKLKEPAPAPVVARPLSPKPELEPPSDTLIRKPNISGPIIVCRKRSSIAGKGSRSSSGAADTKREPKTEEKPKFEWNEPSKSSGSGEEHRITKKRSKERFAPSSSSLKKNSEKNSEEVRTTTPSQNPVKGGGGSSSSSKNLKAKTDNTAIVFGAKKKSAADFLNRMKQNSSPNKGPPLVDTSKSSGGSSKNKGGSSSEQKKSAGGGGGGGGGSSGGGKGEEGKSDQALRRGSTGKMVKEQGSPTKRSAGRPPKRAAAPVAAVVVTGKRNRERVDDVKTVASKQQQPKKRTRK